MTVMKNGAEVVVLQPEKRFYPVAQMPTTEAAIDYGFTRDLYLVLGDSRRAAAGRCGVYIEPFANWLWGGAILMALGGLLSLSDRRYRVAAGARGGANRGACGMSGFLKGRWAICPPYALALFLAVSPAWAVQPDEMLDDPVLESRAREISRDIRCPVLPGRDHR